jgi:hypothetical protein
MGSKKSKPSNSNLRRNIYDNRSRSFSNNRNSYRRRRLNHEILSEIYEDFNISEKDLRRLTTLQIYHVVNLEENDIELQSECPICLEELTTNDEAYLLPCCHFYHKKCLMEWFKKEPVCPNCRLELGAHTQEEVDMSLLNRENKLKKGEEEKKRRLDNNDKDLIIKEDIIIDDSDVFLSDIEKKALIEYYNNKSQILNDLSNIDDVIIDDDNYKENNSVPTLISSQEEVA